MCTVWLDKYHTWSAKVIFPWYESQDYLKIQASCVLSDLWSAYFASKHEGINLYLKQTSFFLLIILDTSSLSCVLLFLAVYIWTIMGCCQSQSKKTSDKLAEHSENQGTLLPDGVKNAPKQTALAPANKSETISLNKEGRDSVTKVCNYFYLLITFRMDNDCFLYFLLYVCCLNLSKIRLPFLNFSILCNQIWT